MNLELTNKEQEALEELSDITGLSNQKVMIQALRLYQMVMLQKVIVTEVYSLPKMCDLDDLEEVVKL